MSRMMLVRCMLILAILLAVSSMATPAMAEVDAREIYTAKSPLQFTVGPRGLWLYEDISLMWYAEDTRQPDSVIQMSGITCLASSERMDLLYYLTDAHNGTQLLHAITSDGTVFLDAVAMAEDERLSAIGMTGGVLYALREDGCVVTVNTPYSNTFALTISGWQNEGVTAFAVYDEQLLAYKAQTGELTLINLDAVPSVVATAMVPSLCDVQIGRSIYSSPTAFAFQETDAGHRLVLIHMNSGDVETVQTHLPADCAGLCRNRETLYTLGRSSTVLYGFSMRELIGEKEHPMLTIVNGRGEHAQMEMAIELFHQRYPDVEIVERGIDDPRVIATEMMAGGEGIDLLGIQDSYMVISAAMLLRSGALMPLEQFDELTALRENFRDIWGWVTTGGHWYAMPATPAMHFWRVNPILAETLRWELPQGRWSWADFMALAERVKAYNETAEKPIYLLQDESGILPYFFFEYQANHIDAYNGVADYASDTYLSLLRMWKYLNDNGLIYIAPDSFRPVMGNDVLLYSERMARVGMGMNTYILPPTETETSRYPVYAVGALTLNANTPHLEEAVHFLACYMSVEAAASRFYSNNGQWLKDVSLYEPVDPHEIILDENDALWNEMLVQGAPELYLYDIMRQQYNTLLPGLVNGTVTPEQFAQISQQLADMMLGE